MHRLQLLSCVMCIFLTAGLAINASAAEPQRELLEEVPPPPKVIEGEPMQEPQITIRKKGTETIEEYRINGELYMMKVTPQGGKPYYMHKNEANGGWVNDGPNPPLSVPHWILFRF